MYVGTVDIEKKFHYSKWESVKCCVKGLGRMDLVLQKLKFYHRLKRSCNVTFVQDISVYATQQLNSECAQPFATYSCIKIRKSNHFLPGTYQIDLRTAKCLNKFLSSENSICKLFENYVQPNLI